MVRLTREAAYLARGRSTDIVEKVGAGLARLREIEQLVDQQLGLKLESLTMLDVGAGQLQFQMAYFGLRNEVVGIDLDVIARGFDARSYLQMLRTNGPARVAKTAGRKLLLVDSRYRRELARQLGVKQLSVAEVIQMDATNTTFADGSFDFAYALAVFQHLEHPDAVISEISRVLRPGGALYLDFILFTSRTGSHDVRLLASQDGSLPLWAHLRPRYRDQVQPNAYVNRLRLADWVLLLESRLPGVEIILRQPEAERLEPAARALWEQGELTDYTLDELLTSKVIVLWRKPPPF